VPYIWKDLSRIMNRDRPVLFEHQINGCEFSIIITIIIIIIIIIIIYFLAR